MVWRRTDFRESSRIVTCLTREHGRITGLAKGAHRADSPLLGRLDFLNEVRATFSADRGGLRLLLRAELVRERRALREPARFLAASHLAQLCDFAMPDRPEPAVYDLLTGGLNLLERCPVAAIPQVVLGLELRYLDLLGALPDLERCSSCGGALPSGAFVDADSRGLVCRTHATPPRRAVSAAVLGLLCTLRATSGREWPDLQPATPPRLAAPLPASWLLAATEQRPRFRHLVFRAADPEPGAENPRSREREHGT
ncbi:MAG TPA: DNA repair protein RecO [Planctomycetota bacterium]